MRLKVSRKVISVTAIMLLLLIVALSCFEVNYYFYSSKIHSFTIDDYAENISRCRADDYYNETIPETSGRIDNIKDAKDYADKLWKQLYGESLKDEKPYIVEYDSVNKAWHVRGSLSFGVRLGHFLGDRNFKGGVAHFIFNESDGQILAVWHDK